MSPEVFLAVAVLMLVCIGTYFVAGRLRVPYTALLRAEEMAMEELLEEEMLPRKIAVLLSRDLGRGAGESPA